MCTFVGFLFENSKIVTNMPCPNLVPTLIKFAQIFVKKFPEFENFAKSGHQAERRRCAACSS
jgi:hypothetical protein